MSSPLAHAPAPYDAGDCVAFLALARGEASEAQQRRVLDWIIHKAANTYDLSYRPGDAGATAFAEGRRYVGLQVVKMTRSDTLAALEKKGAK